MSVVRKSSTSDVYIFEFDDNKWECSACELRTTNEFVILYSTEEVIAHMDKHREVGHKVPDYAYERMRDTTYDW